MRHMGLVLLLSLFSSVAAFPAVQDPASAAIQSDSKVGEYRRNVFSSGRELLLGVGVPFDPDELLKRNWRRTLKPTLDAMPEMKQVRHVTAPLAGVYIADTLYLPESVRIAGNTVLLVKKVVFEGKAPVVVGPHSLHIFQLSPPAVLGCSLSEALNKAGWIQTDGSLPSFAAIQGSLTLEPGRRISFNVSGLSAQSERKHR